MALKRFRRKSKKKGLSVEEKRTRMMEFFYEKKDFFQLKELEKQCQKEKGITSMSVKDILQSLVDDGMVDTEKLERLSTFGRFQAKRRKRKLEDTTRQLDDVEKNEKQPRQISNKQKLEERNLVTCRDFQVKKGSIREATFTNFSEKRAQLLKELGLKAADKKRLLAELESYKDCDPEVMDQMKRDIVVAKEAANRWTDNIFSVKSWIKNKFSFEESVIDKQFDIPEGFDYLD